MDKEQKRKNNTNLVIILIALCVIAALLVIMIIIGAVNDQNKIEEAVNNSEYSDLYWEGMNEEEYQYAKATEDYFEAQKKLDELFAQESVDLNQINEIYDDGISNANDANVPDVANDYVMDRNTRLIEKGMKEEALNALLSVDQSMYDYYSSQKYRFYTMVIELAEELGKNDIVTEYKTLRESVAASFEQKQKEINQISEEMDEESNLTQEDINNMKEEL